MKQALSSELDILVNAASYESTVGEARRLAAPDLSGAIYHAASAGGRVPLLKVLLSNVCENDCFYCANRASRSVRRCSLTPERLAAAFDRLYRSGLVKGLFLSSGLCGNAVATMDRLLDTVEIVRTKYEFRGYVHLKIMPGATADQIERAGQVADRVSVNLEAPNPARLGQIAPDKSFEELAATLAAISSLSVARRPFAPAGATTQFVAGASGESDDELLSTADTLYRRYNLARVYYSAFRPVSQTPLAEAPPMLSARERRLYQADALLRRYGFTAEELPFDERGNLPARVEPKIAWAMRHPEAFPVEVNAASRQELLRVPGIGPTIAERIVRARRQTRLRDVGQLAKLGARPTRLAPFVLLDGKRPDCQQTLPFFEEDEAS